MCKPMHLSLVFTVNSKVLKYLTILMCLKDLEDKGIEKEKPEDMEKSNDCPLCLEPLEMDDKNFYPCACGYQVCRFCWHRIKTTENGLCPACRRIYPENPANFVPLTAEELQKCKHAKKMKEVQKKQKLTENRKHLANIRVIQKNLVFAVGLPLELSQDVEKKDKVLQMFRQFGHTQKETITDRTSYAGAQGPSACVYITYQKPEDAVKAVKSLANTKVDGRTIKVSLGTTKYCSNFLKGAHCPKTECLYLHEIADEEASFTKEEIHAGKHVEYETKLLEQTYNSSCNSKFPSTSSENNCTNHNHNAEEGSESSDDLHQSNSFTNSDISDLSPSSNQSLQNSRNICAEIQNQIENNLQNLHLSNSELRTNSDLAKKLVFRSEENLIINNPSFQENVVNSHFSNHIQSNESEQQQQQQHHSMQQPIFLNNQIFESASRGQSSPKESSILRIISSAKFENGLNQSLPDLLSLNREQMEKIRPKRDDDPDLEFDPCQESLKGLQDLLQFEAKERERKAKEKAREAARIRLNAMNRSPISNSPVISRSPLFANLHSAADSLGFRNSSFQASKMRDPPPGFSNSSSQNLHFKSPFEFPSSVLHESPASLQNHAGNLRTNFSLQRFQLPGASVNNSYFPDFSPPSLPTREIPEFSSPIMQQQNQRHVNVSQLPFSISDQRTSPQWNSSSQSHWRPMENLFFNQSVTESGTTNDYSLRMPPVRSNEATMRQWQQFPTNVNNLSPFHDHPLTPEQLAKLQVLKAVESAQRNSGFGHRLQYTKKL